MSIWLWNFVGSHGQWELLVPNLATQSNREELLVPKVVQHYVQLPSFENVPAGLAAVTTAPGSADLEFKEPLSAE